MPDGGIRLVSYEVEPWASRPVSGVPARAAAGAGRRPSASATGTSSTATPTRRMLRKQGARCMDCGVPFCHTGDAHRGHGLGLPDQQPHPRVERPRLPRPVAGGPRTAAQDQQLPRVHRPRLPRPVRGLVRPRHQRAAGDDQEHRVRHHRQGLRGRLGHARAAAGAHRQEGRRRRLRARRGWPPPPSSTGPATGSPSSSAPTASADC